MSDMQFAPTGGQALMYVQTGNHLQNYKSLLQIAELFDVSVDWLMGRTDKREVNQ